MQVGDGTSVATIGDTKLQSEKFRISMTTDGFRTAAGTVARYGAVFIPSAPSHTVAESGIFDAPGGGTPFKQDSIPSESENCAFRYSLIFIVYPLLCIYPVYKMSLVLQSNS